MSILRPLEIETGYGEMLPYPERKYYAEAFRGDFSMWWGTTKFSGEIEEMCFYRALTCFYRAAMDDIEDRRKLLYYYMRREFASSSLDDDIVRLSHKLPVDSTVRKALRNLCIAYNAPPKRSFGTEADAEAYNEDFDRAYQEIGFDRVAQNVYRLAKLCNVVAVRPFVDDDGELYAAIFAPDMYRVERSGTKVTEFWYRTEREVDGEKEFVLRVWKKDVTYYADHEGAEIEGTREPNPYGRIPFSFLQIDIPENDDPYGGSMFELIEANLQANQKEFAANVGLVMNGFGVWVMTNAETATGEAVSLSPAKVIRATGVKGGEGDELPPDVEHVTGNSMFGEIRSDKVASMREELKMTGLPDSLVSENVGTPASGIARVIERQELIEQRDADKLSLKDFENDWAHLLAVVANVGNWNGGVLPEDFEFSIDFAEEKIFLEPNDDYDLARKKAENGDLDLVQYGREVMGIDEPDPKKIATIIAKRRELWKESQGSGPTETSAPATQPFTPPLDQEVNNETEMIENDIEPAVVDEEPA